MNIFALLLIALSLSVDCFAVAVSASISQGKVPKAGIIRTAFAFGLAQFVMPNLGWLGGRTVVDLISAYDHWAAFGLLGLAGGRMIWESFHGEEARAVDITRGWSLFTMAIATSIDSLAVGLSFAFLNVNILASAILIGIVAFLATVMGFALGSRANELLEKRAKLIGGIVLIGIGVRILLSHLL